MARLPYQTRDELPPEYQELFDVDAGTGSDSVLNIYRALANNPRLFRSWMLWMDTLWDESANKRIRELAILAVAREIDARYEWHQHVPIALDSGVTRAEILAISDGAFDGFSDAEAAVMVCATAVAGHSPDDETFDELARNFDDGTVLALTLLASEYLRIGAVVDALGIEPREPFVGWQLEGVE